jgi:hypothetical protein
MIELENKIITQLLSAIYRDKTDSSVVRVNTDSVIKILSNFGYNLPTKIFEAKLEEMLNKKLVGANISVGTNFAISRLMLDLANKMNVSMEDITRYLTANPQEQDAKETQEKIKQWRKQYYGSMDKQAKQKLIDSLGDKLRPEVLDQIRGA